MKMHFILISFILLKCHYFGLGQQETVEGRIYFPDELIQQVTITTTEASIDKNNRTALNIYANRICGRKYNVPKPEPKWWKKKSVIKCEEYRHHYNELEYAQWNEGECRRAMNAAGYYFVIVGKAAVPGEFPHMAALGWLGINGSYVFKCGGSLISERYVLTAAHCLIVSNRDTSVASQQPVIVRLGDQNILDHVYDGLTPVEFNITRSIRHPMYKPPSKYYDVALLELSDDVKFDRHVRPACLWSDQHYGTYTQAVVTGWGVTSVGSLTTSPELMKTTVDLLDTQMCEKLLKPYWNRHWKGFANHQMCAGVLAGGPDTCQGDSGGPIQVNEVNQTFYHVMGVTSFGFQCGREGVPAIYTRVSDVLDWIESVVWPGFLA